MGIQRYEVAIWLSNISKNAASPGIPKTGKAKIVPKKRFQPLKVAINPPSLFPHM